MRKVKKLTGNWSRLTLLVLLVINLLWFGSTNRADAQDADEVPSVTISGLDGPVDIIRDEWGIPTIIAGTDHDLFLGFGYAMAQDRMWQMDGSRRVALGKVAEIGGRNQLHWDIYHRTLGFERIARESIDLLEPETLEYLQAYADGINAYIEDNRGNLGFEFLLMGYEPEPWTVLDSLVIVRLVAVWLASDSFDEEMYGNLVKWLGQDLADQLFMPVPLTEPITDPSNLDASLRDISDTRSAGLNSPVEESVIQNPLDILKDDLISGWLSPLAAISQSGTLDASNIWAVDGSLTESGEPILATDPHLNYFAPSVLYEARLEGDKFKCWGATFPGMPFIPFGANEHIAWGASNFPADTQDLYIEMLNPENPFEYSTQAGWEEFEVIEERITYPGEQDTEEVYLHKVYVSSHGPIVHQGWGEYLAMKWTGLDPSDDVSNFVHAMLAENLEEFYEAFRDYHCPAQNIIIAENGPDGRVGQIFIGQIPIRSGYTGGYPVRGNDPSYQWTGFIPYDDMPHNLDPPEGYVAHANNVPVGGFDCVEGVEYPLGRTFTPNHRVNRIIELILAEAPLTLDENRLMQMDDLDMTARDFVPILLDAWSRSGDHYPGLEDHMSVMTDWDYHLGPDSVAATFYQLWILELVQTCIIDFFPYHLTTYIGFEDRWLPVIQTYLEGETDLSWLMADTQVERDARALESFEDAIDRLQREAGSDPDGWLWGDLNLAVFPHPSGEAVLIGGGSHRFGGGRYTVRVGHYAHASTLPFENDFGAVFRTVLESDGDTWIIEAVLPPGESGVPFGPHGTDQMNMWLAGELRSVPFGNLDCEISSSCRLVPE